MQYCCWRWQLFQPLWACINFMVNRVYFIDSLWWYADRLRYAVRFHPKQKNLLNKACFVIVFCVVPDTCVFNKQCCVWDIAGNIFHATHCTQSILLFLNVLNWFGGMMYSLLIGRAQHQNHNNRPIQRVEVISVVLPGIWTPEYIMILQQYGTNGQNPVIWIVH